MEKMSLQQIYACPWSRVVLLTFTNFSSADKTKYEYVWYK